MQGEWNIVYS